MFKAYDSEELFQRDNCKNNCNLKVFVPMFDDPACSDHTNLDNSNQLQRPTDEMS